MIMTGSSLTAAGSVPGSRSAIEYFTESVLPPPFVSSQSQVLPPVVMLLVHAAGSCDCFPQIAPAPLPLFDFKPSNLIQNGSFEVQVSFASLDVLFISIRPWPPAYKPAFAAVG